MTTNQPTNNNNPTILTELAPVSIRKRAERKIKNPSKARCDSKNLKFELLCVSLWFVFSSPFFLYTISISSLLRSHSFDFDVTLLNGPTSSALCDFDWTRLTLLCLFCLSRFQGRVTFVIWQLIAHRIRSVSRGQDGTGSACAVMDTSWSLVGSSANVYESLIMVSFATWTNSASFGWD